MIGQPNSDLNDDKCNRILTCGSKDRNAQRPKLEFLSLFACVLPILVSISCTRTHSSSFADADNDPLWTFKFPGEGLGFDSSGRLLIIVHHGVVEVRNMESGRQVHRVEKPGQHFNVLAMDKDRSMAYCATIKGEISRLDLQKFELSEPIVKTPSRIYGLAVTSKGAGILALYDSTINQQTYEVIGSKLKLYD